MKAKILYIDPIYQPGHINFNQIYINYLYKEGYSIDFFFINDYAKKLSLKAESKVFSIKSEFLTRRYNPLFNRFLYLYTLLYIRYKVNIKEYDYLLFSSYEEISFFFSFFSGVYIINHVNLQKIHSPIKKVFITQVFKKNNPIVLSKESYNLVRNNFAYKRLILSRHGLLPPFSIDCQDSRFAALVSKYKHVIFSPSDNSSDFQFLRKLLSSEAFLQYLQRENILFVVRTKEKIVCSINNILCISHYLDEKDYRFLFLKSDVIVIIYPHNFIYRVSGVLFECFSNMKMCLLSDIDSFREYSSFFKYNPYFGNTEELIDGLNNCIHYVGMNPFNSLDSLSPSINFK
ncbi:hypothetical protein [Mediterranea massiliensis]|uniref:hypothetical protein n=1 Tax=Mediterranea massiliensis TaxID=1841865 RepID=UPI0025A3E5F7|nr:hypothetical protein [Mediterranea massiliensis]MDM8336360.1 hypothetical protein [Mediterranea massiliensis]